MAEIALNMKVPVYGIICLCTLSLLRTTQPLALNLKHGMEIHAAADIVNRLTLLPLLLYLYVPTCMYICICACVLNVIMYVKCMYFLY